MKFSNNSLVKNVVLLSMFTVHYSTRTIVLPLYYVSICFVICGPNNFITAFCYVWSFGVLCMNFFLVLLFNLKFSRSWAIDLVGIEYYNKYLSHSYAALKTFAAVLGGFLGLSQLENRTGTGYGEQNTRVNEIMTEQIERNHERGNHEAANGIQESLNEINRNFTPGGILSRGFESGGLVLYGPNRDAKNPVCSLKDMEKIVFKED